MKIKWPLLICVLAVLLALHGCYYDVEEELYPQNLSGCDTSGTTYSGTVVTILTNGNCLSCHSAGSPQGGVVLDSYNQVKTYVDNGRLLGALRWDNGYAAMPLGGSRTDACTLAKIEAWVNAGAPNN